MKNIYLILIVTFSLFRLTAYSQITGITPNQAMIGLQGLKTTITSNSQFVTSATPSGNLNEAYIYQGAYRINLFTQNSFPYNNNAVVSHPDTCKINSINIPINAPTGLYNLVVKTQDPSGIVNWVDTLPSAFTVLAPDGYIRGNIYEDANMNGQRDVNESGLYGPVAYTIQPMTGATQYYYTDTLGNYSIPAMNGNYTINWAPGYSCVYYLTTDSNSYTVTMNGANITGLDFGLRRGLTALAPSQNLAGRTVNFTVTSRHLFIHGTGSGNNINYIYIGNYYSNAITVVDSNTATFNITFPPNATPGLYDLTVYINSGGSHILKNCYTILPYDAFLSGNIYFDSNGNGLKDTLEPKLSNERVSVIPDSGYGFSDLNGDYSIGVLNGNHTVAWAPTPQDIFQLSSDSASFTVNSNGNVNGLDFGLITTNPNYTCDVSLTGNFPRCNSNVWYYLTYENKSNIPFNGQVYFIKDPTTTYFYATVPPSSFSGDTIFWNYANLQPFIPATIRITISIPFSGYLSYHAGQTSVDGSGNVQFTDVANISQLIRCSYDPNDKSVTPEGVGPEHFTLMTDWLEYLVRFQNTGTDTAINVTVYDHLSQDLDLSTFELLESSHAVNTEIKNNVQAIFTFANIMLPDSNVDEQNSHGYFKYRIKARNTISDFTNIENTAFIVFDSNAAVVTNTTNNMMTNFIPVGLNDIVKETGHSLVYPNPFSSAALLVFNNPKHLNAQIELRDVLGNLVRVEKSSGEEYVIRKNELANGIYFYRLIFADEHLNSSGKMIIR